MVNVLIVEDDKNTRRLMECTIRDGGYRTFAAKDAEEALDILAKHHIHLAVVDIMLPKMSGYELTKLMRESKMNLPMLMVTAKGEPSDIKKGFLVGIDDYMIKPVDEEEMLLRIKALLRRSHIVSERKLAVGSTTLSYDTFSVNVDNEVQILPKKEFLLLYKLLSYPERTFTRLQLMDEIWGMDSESDENTVSVHINRLRARFKQNADFEIVTVRGLGYKINRL